MGCFPHRVQPAEPEQQSMSRGLGSSRAGLKWGPGLCGWGSQVRLLRTSKAYKCLQATVQLFCRAAPSRERIWGSCGVTWLVFRTLGEEDLVWVLRRDWELVFWSKDVTLIILWAVCRLRQLTIFGSKSHLGCV